MNLVSCQVNTKKTHTANQYVMLKPKRITKNQLVKTLKISGLVVMVLAGFVFANYILSSVALSSHMISSDGKTSSINPGYETQNAILTSAPGIDGTPNDSFNAQYVNCIGLSDGTSLTIKCPTDYGLVYKAIVEIPNDLMLQFEGKVFHMRNFSVLENSNHIVIVYQKQTYVTTFVAS